MSQIIIITGQTATGKTKKALQIAASCNGELINCDSRQIYKKLDIVTGKDYLEKNFIIDRKINGFDVGHYTLKILNPKLKILNKLQTPNPKSLSQRSINPRPSTLDPSRKLRVNQRSSTNNSHSIPLWLYDVVDPKQYFSSYDYKILALDVISDILKRGKTPIIVGGAGYYLYHLLYDIPTSGISQNWSLRNSLSNKKIEELQNEYKGLNPDAFEKLNNSEKNNSQRLIRKIEIALYEKKHNIKSDMLHISASLMMNLHLPENALKIQVLLENNKEKLKNNIETRVDQRLKSGAIEEVKHLLKERYLKSDPGIKTIGYVQLITYLAGKISLEEAKQEWITKELQYTKRQETFLRKYII